MSEVKVRINKYLASAGVAARRKIDAMIEAGAVTVNGQKAILGQRVDPQRDEIAVNGKVITEGTEKKEGIEKIYIALNKPKGVTSTTADPHAEKTVINLVNVEGRLFPVGRLDRDSEGLMILTNDGEFANRITHPRYGVEKTYQVWVRGDVNSSKLGRIRNGIEIDGEKTGRIKVDVIRETEHSTLLAMVLAEGKKREIRRIAAELRLHVLFLKRVAIGNLYLGDLESGKWRKLNQDEVADLLKSPRTVSEDK